MDPFWLLTGAAFVCGVVCIVSEQAGYPPGVYVCKPATMLCIIAIALLATPSTQAYRSWIVAGLVLSLVGDILLMLPRDRFIAGLAAFMIAHWCYIAAFAPAFGAAGLPWLLPWLAVGALVVWLLRPAGAVMKLAIGAYALSIVTMAWLAVETWRLSPGWLAGGATLAALGAVAFVTSDTLLGARRFRGDWPFARVWILGTYFPAQGLMAASAYF